MSTAELRRALRRVAAQLKHAAAIADLNADSSEPSFGADVVLYALAGIAPDLKVLRAGRRLWRDVAPSRKLARLKKFHAPCDRNHARRAA